MRNTRSLALHLDQVKMSESQVQVISESDVLEYEAEKLRTRCVKTGWNLAYGASTKLGNKLSGRRGRRVAILSRALTPLVASRPPSCLKGNPGDAEDA